MRYRVRHRNRYQYVHPVSLSHSHATLLPRDTLNQQVLSARLTILPGTDDVHERQDLFGNRVSRFSIEEVHTELNVLAESEVEV
ncbi:transglutaminase family protein, partial [Litoricolaceae bacterium]|nr:transglutaminase family protein [Litorivicinaceae bacterium]